MRPVSQKCIDLVKHYEGCKLNSYQDSVNVWTIGYGTTIIPPGTARNVHEGMTITLDQAEQYLSTYLQSFADNVDAMVNVEINEDQRSALTSFSYNLGSGSLKSSTLLKLINQSKFDDAQREFVKWNKAGGKIMDGLTLRRKAEACLFSTGQVKFDFSRDAATQDYLA